MGSFFKECEHPRSRWSKCPHPYRVRYRSAAGRQLEESGFATQDAAIERLTEIYKAKKAAPRGQAKAERIARYGAMRFEEYATEWKAGQRDLGPASVVHLESLLIPVSPAIRTCGMIGYGGCRCAARHRTVTAHRALIDIQVLGGIGLCQVAVHLSYVTTDGHALIDRRLYLSEDWAGDDERREVTGVLDETVFATKPQLAGDMLAAAHAAGIRTAWVAADEVYGGSALRRRIRTLGYGYAIAVPTSHRVTTPGGGKEKLTALLQRVPKRAWMRMRTGNGTKGARLYDWAMIDMRADDTPPGQDAGHSQVLIRRHRRTGTLSFYRTWHPDPQPVSVLVSALPPLAGRRGHSRSQGPHRPRPGPGHLLDLLAPLEPDVDDRLRAPRRRSPPRAATHRLRRERRRAGHGARQPA
nr:MULTISPECIES: transposase [unclassified Streptomyces]